MFQLVAAFARTRVGPPLDTNKVAGTLPRVLANAATSRLLLPRSGERGYESTPSPAFWRTRLRVDSFSRVLANAATNRLLLPRSGERGYEPTPSPPFWRTRLRTDSFSPVLANAATNRLLLPLRVGSSRVRQNAGARASSPSGRGKVVKKSRGKSPRRTETIDEVTAHRHSEVTVGRTHVRRLNAERAATQHTATCTIDH